MKQNTVNLILVLAAFIIIVAIMSQKYSSINVSMGSDGLNVKARRDNTTFVNLSLAAHELGLPG
jgi:hypothetical protein